MENKNLRVAIFPIGSAIKFNKNRVKRSDGSLEYLNTFKILALNPSISELWILQRSDWKKLTDEEKIEIDPRGVIRDIYEEFKIVTSAETFKNSDGYDVTYKHLWDSIKHLEQPHFGIGFTAQGLTNVNIPGIIRGIRNPNEMRKSLAMTAGYAAPVIHYLNMSSIPWFLSLPDPRYVSKNQKWRDLVNGPRSIISQYNETIKSTHFESYPINDTVKEITHDLKLHYTGIEKLNLFGTELKSPSNERDIKFSIVAMQSCAGNAVKDYRYEELKKFILDRKGTDDYSIWGKWDERFTLDFPQFKGYATSSFIDDIFNRTKYTLVIPIGPNWVTSKYAEMLQCGVLPFFHPQYDTQFNVLPKDHFLRVKDGDDLFLKINLLEKDDNKRISLVKMLQDKLLNDTTSGIFFYRIINKFLLTNDINVRLLEEKSDQILRKPKNIVTSLF